MDCHSSYPHGLGLPEQIRWGKGIVAIEQIAVFLALPPDQEESCNHPAHRQYTANDPKNRNFALGLGLSWLSEGGAGGHPVCWEYFVLDLGLSWLSGYYLIGDCEDDCNEQGRYQQGSNYKP